MRFNLKLWHKGLILVSVPLAFEIIFVGVLASMLKEADREIEIESHARTVVARTNEVLRFVLNSVGAASIYNITQGHDFELAYARDVQKIPGKFLELKEVLAGDEQRVRSIDRLQAQWSEINLLLINCKNLLDHDRRLEAATYLPRLRKVLMQIRSALENIVEEEQDIADAGTRAQIKTRHALMDVLKIGVVFNIFLAVTLAVFFNRSTSRKLNGLLDNIERFGSREPLNPLLDGEDELTMIDKVFHEMAIERKQYEEMISAAGARIALLIESMPVGLAVVDDTGTLETINSALLQLSGYTKEELLGKRLQMLFEGDDEEESQEALIKELVAKSLGRISERDVLKKDGKSLPVELSFTDYSVRGAHRYLVVMLDVSERQEVERLKREFVAMVSHELRTPLTSLQGFVTLLATGTFGALNEKGLRKVDSADQNIARLINLINDLLDIEKMESGRFEMQFEEIDLAFTVGRAIDAVRGFAEAHQVTLSAETEKLAVIADGDRLVQVIVNFLSNAVKFSPPQSTVTARIVSQPDKLLVQVVDRGRGIPKDRLASVFEKFYQVERGDGEKRAGSGLGLAICKAIIEEHGGEIGVESEEGEGSTFWFSLPLTGV